MKVKFKDTLRREGLQHPITPSGRKTRDIIKWRYNDDGVMIRKKTDEENVYERIQAARDGTDLQLMLKRYAAGDESALAKVEGMYIDTADMPKNFHELYNAVAIHNDVFNSMPAEIKEKYHNNPAEYWKAYGTDSFDETMNAFRKEVFAEKGMVDPNPVKTAPDIKPVEKPVEVVEKGVINESQSE